MCAAAGTALLVGPAAAQIAAPPPDCAALRDTTPLPRWLTLPNSRLVVNPFYGQYLGHSGASGSADGVLPVSLAYYVGAAPVSLPAFWSLLPGGPAQVVAGPRFSLSDPGQWQRDGADAAFKSDSVSVTSTGSFGALSRTVTVNLDKTPTLCVQTPPGSAAFAMKVSDGVQAVDTALPPVERFGAATADVAAATGWHGVRTFQVRLFVFRSHPVTFTRIQFVKLPEPPALPEETTWMPQEIQSRARAGAASGTVQSAVVLPDANSVSQRLVIGPAGPDSLTLAGQFEGSIHWDAVRNTLLLSGENFSAAVCFSRPAHWLGIRPTPLDWALGSASSTRSGAWRLRLSGLKPRETIVVAARFTPAAGGGTASAAAAQALATPAAFSAALGRNTADWNRRLALVPRPLDFAPRSIDAKGVTAAEIRRSYYRAWAFLLSDTLPPMPENGFPYPQICAGKPSLWTDGAPHSESTAVWDSASAMQALALVAPKAVWPAAEGVMSQVGKDGYLAGESLPAVFAQTFWDLYRQTGDKAKLGVIYPALKRYLIWKIAHPRWVYPNRSRADVRPSTEKDNEYVVHEVIDLGYAVKIAAALGKPEDAAFWRRQRLSAAADYRRWFLPPGDTVYRLYYSETERIVPNHVWNIKGLQLPNDLLPASGRETLLGVFRAQFNAAQPFGLSQTRFGDLEPITLGLFSSGQVASARQMTDLALRDVTRAGEFSEYYTQDNPPRPAGVRPSSFGARLMVDSALWHNGVVLDEGFPALLGMPGAVGVDALPVRGLPIAVRFDGAAHRAMLSGPGLKWLRLPPGFRAVVQGSRTEWTGPIAEGQTIALEGRDAD